MGQISMKTHRTPGSNLNGNLQFVYACDEIVQAEQNVVGFESLSLKVEVLRFEDAGDAGI